MGNRLHGNWTDDGHTVVPVLDYDSVRLRFECPGEGKCEANKMGCGDCEGSGCPTCDDTGLEKDVPEGFCWVRDMAPEWDFLEAFHTGGKVDLTGDTRILWIAAWDEWEWTLRKEEIDD